jgi:colanic acid/amylovoran biosynthesis glycosyltransferase
VKIAYFVSRFPEQCQTFVRREIDEVVRRGHDVSVFPVASTPSAARAQASDACACSSVIYPSILNSGPLLKAFCRDPKLCGALLVALIRDTWYRPLTLAKSLVAFAKGMSTVEIVKTGGYDHIHAHWSSYPGTAAWVVSALTGIPFSVAFHAYDLFSTRIALNEKIEAASTVVLNAQYSIDFFRRLYPKVPDDKVMLLYNGLNRDRFAIVARDRPLVQSCPLILGVGRLVYTKGFRTLVEACHLLDREGRTFRLVLIGKGPEARGLSQLIDTFGLQASVSMVGELPQQGVSRYISESAVLVMPCIVPRRGASHDALPNVIIEAQAAGVPVIGSDVFAIPETVRHEETGLLVPPGDAAALKGAIARVVDDAALAEQIAKRGWEEAQERFNVHENVARLLERFEKAGVVS